MFERTEVWERTDDFIWVYVLFRDLRTGLFHLQQANALYPDDPTKVTRLLEQMRLSEPDLFREQCPSERSLGFPTATAAIADHKTEFAEMLPLTR